MNWRRVEKTSTRGHRFVCWEPVMPRFPDQMLESIVYLYPSVDSAREGRGEGGTGFLLSVPPTRQGAPRTVYAVSNTHVVKGGDRVPPSPVIRINTTDGGIDVLPLEACNWEPHPDGDDIAVCALDLDKSFHAYSSMQAESWLLSRADVLRNGVGPGDDVFVIGRFQGRAGKERNYPTSRFGAIAQMPNEPVAHPQAGNVESFLIEAHSVSGYSGAPVFLHIAAGSLRHLVLEDAETGTQASAQPARETAFLLLGVDWGHLPYWDLVYESDQSTPTGEYVRSNSLMMQVAPSWKLHELLFDYPKVVTMRKQREDAYIEDHGEVVLDSMTDAYTADDFMTDLAKVTEPERRDPAE